MYQLRRWEDLMDVTVAGRGVDIGDAFKTHAQTRLQDIAAKFFSRAMSSHVALGHEAHGHGFHVDCTMHVRRGVVLKAEARGGDAHGAFDSAASRIEKQLRRYKRRLTNHHLENGTDAGVADASYTVLEQHAEEDVSEGDNPVIIAETKTQIPTVAVSDAVMLMDLKHAPALMFRDSKSGHLSMVYRREDGNIGWVEAGA
jgi:ribosomal subunit interface protein